MSLLSGIHAVREALASGRALERIVVARGRRGERFDEIVRLARQRGVPVRFEDRQALERLVRGEHHQGVVAVAGAAPAQRLEDLLRPPEHGGLLVLLDGVEDPHNLGAIVRTALAAGADGVVIPQRRSAGLTDTVARVSSGALEHLPVAVVTNLARAMEQLKSAGYWLVGLDERADKVCFDADLTGPVGLVLGGEGEGLHQLVRRGCDFLVSIPTSGPVRSLNVSVAAGVVLLEVVRQRRAARKSAQA